MQTMEDSKRNCNGNSTIGEVRRHGNENRTESFDNGSFTWAPIDRVTLTDRVTREKVSAEEQQRAWMQATRIRTQAGNGQSNVAYIPSSRPFQGNSASPHVMLALSAAARRIS